MKKQLVPLLGLAVLAVAGMGYQHSKNADANLSDLSASVIEKSATQESSSSLTPFACDNTIYLMQIVNGTSLVSVVDKNTADFTPIGPAGQYNHNATAVNPVDGFMYGFTGGQVIKIGQNMQEELIGSKLDVSGNPYSGAFLADGTYVANTGSTFYHIDLNNGNPQIIKTIAAGGSFADIARNPIDGFFYGFNNSTQKMSRVNVHTGEASDYSQAGVQIDNKQAGAAFFTSDGTLFLYGIRTDGKRQDTLFVADTTTGSVVTIKTGEEIGGSDGASCVKGKDADPDANPEATPEPTPEPTEKPQATATSTPLPVADYCRPSEDGKTGETLSLNERQVEKTDFAGGCSYSLVCTDVEGQTQEEILSQNAEKFGLLGECPEPEAEIDICRPTEDGRSGENMTVKASKVLPTDLEGDCEFTEVCVDRNEGKKERVLSINAGLFGTLGECIPDDGNAGEAEVLEDVIVTACQFADEKTGRGAQCVAMFPVPEDAAGQKYFQCVESGGIQAKCLDDWSNEKDLQLCNTAANCEGEVEEIIVPEYDYDQGCFLYQDEVYCPHQAEGYCYEVEGQKLCQSKDQRCLMQRISYEKTDWPAGTEYIKKRNNVIAVMGKYCVYNDELSGEFDANLQEPEVSIGLTQTVNVCQPQNEHWLNGPALMLTNRSCVTTYPLDGASKNFDRYDICRKQGKTDQECVDRWVTGSGYQLCETHSDC